MLDTNLKHIENKEQYAELVNNKSTFAVVCGRMGPMCIPVYETMEALEEKYPGVQFYDMDFDSPTGWETIRRLPETRSFNGLPFTVYFKEGKVVAATSSIQTKQQIREILDSRMA